MPKMNGLELLSLMQRKGPNFALCPLYADLAGCRAAPTNGSQSWVLTIHYQTHLEEALLDAAKQTPVSTGEINK